MEAQRHILHLSFCEEPQDLLVELWNTRMESEKMEAMIESFEAEEIDDFEDCIHRWAQIDPSKKTIQHRRTGGITRSPS